MRTDRADQEEDEEDDVPEHSSRYIPPWKRVLLVVAVLAIGAGFALRAFGDGGASEGTRATSQQSGSTTLSTSLLPQGSGQTGEAPQTAETKGEEGLAKWSPFLVKGGFGFVVGFCLGYALRAFFKLSAIALGVVFLALFGLQHFQIVTIDWSAFSRFYDDLVARFSGQFENIEGALRGSLSSVAMAGLGLLTGFKGRS